MRIFILSSIISPLPSARWRSSPNVCVARRKAQCWYLQDYRRRCISLESGSKSSHFHGTSPTDGSGRGNAPGFPESRDQMPTRLRRLCHTHLAMGIAAYRISSFRFVNPRKCNIQTMQVWTLSFVRLSFVAMSQSLSLCRPSDKLGPTLPLFPRRHA
jgi:hypothetical protein